MCKAKRFLFPNPKTMQPFLALITPLSSGEPGTPTHPIVIPPEPPVGIWPSPGHPAHPIAPGGPPPGIWPGPGYPSHPIAPGGPPPGIWPGPGHPEHPIVIPPDGLAPGIPSHPIYWPPYPSQGPGFPTNPIAPGGPPPTPTHPIVIPGDDEANPKFEVKTAWSPQTGWIVVIVPGESATVPTPSEAAPS
jgi:hypothetical protein